VIQSVRARPDELERSFRLPGGRRARVRFTSAADGDLRVDRPAAALAAARSALLDRPWTWLQQAHGGDVVVVRAPGQHAGAIADAAVGLARTSATADGRTGADGPVLAIHTADCAPVALVSPEGILGAVHAGWRGLQAGIVEATVAQMRTEGASTVRAVLGPCIHAECYEFGTEDLERLVARLGPQVRGQTSNGRPAFDAPAAVERALRRAGVDSPDVVPVCTACDTRFFSYRARGDDGRQAMLVWLE
jgi:polyphenol oxidase